MYVDAHQTLYGMVWYGMVWYGMVWYGTVCYGKVCYGIFSIYLMYYPRGNTRIMVHGLVNLQKCGLITN